MLYSAFGVLSWLIQRNKSRCVDRRGGGGPLQHLVAPEKRRVATASPSEVRTGLAAFLPGQTVAVETAVRLIREDCSIIRGEGGSLH